MFTQGLVAYFDAIEIECCATITFLLQENAYLSEKKISDLVFAWTNDNATRFDETAILKGIQILFDSNIIEKQLLGYTLTNGNKVKL